MVRVNTEEKGNEKRHLLGPRSWLEGGGTQKGQEFTFGLGDLMHLWGTGAEGPGASWMGKPSGEGAELGVLSLRCRVSVNRVHGLGVGSTCPNAHPSVPDIHVHSLVLSPPACLPRCSPRKA